MPWLPLPCILESHLSKHAADDKRFFLVFHLRNVGCKTMVSVYLNELCGGARGHLSYSEPPQQASHDASSLMVFRECRRVGRLGGF
jgi:hypothetical protein